MDTKAFSSVADSKEILSTVSRKRIFCKVLEQYPQLSNKHESDDYLKWLHCEVHEDAHDFGVVREADFVITRPLCDI